MTGAARGACLAAAAALSLGGCTIDIEDWNVACGFLDQGTCRPVVEVALKNLAWRHPAKPQGTIRIDARGCPIHADWPGWADPSQCWQVVIPLVPGDLAACMVIARLREGSGYGQVGGDEYSLPASTATRGCPA
jgi:hypothetical protein